MTLELCRNAGPQALGPALLSQPHLPARLLGRWLHMLRQPQNRKPLWRKDSPVPRLWGEKESFWILETVLESAGV